MAAEALYKQMNTGDLAANLWTSLQSAGQQALEEIELIPDLKLTKELYGRLQKAQDAAGWISYYRISRDGYVLLRAQQNAALVGRRWRQAMDAARQLDRTAGGGKANDARMKFLRLNEQGCEEYLWLKDSSIMVRVPAGSFQMGLPGGEGPDADILPSVYVDEFLVDKCEITNHQYRRFCDEANRPYPEDPGFVHLPGYFVAYPTCPVSNVSMGDAAAYCAWAGKRIPTEAEWGKAARGTVFRLYPWGNSEPNGRLCNAAGRAAPNTRGQPSAVGIHPLGASPYGCMDMAGNVWEWCSSGVPLGGSFASEPDYLCTGSLGYRTPPVRDRDLGFRCVASSVVSAGQADAPILPLSDVEEEPRQIWTPELEYPADARRAGIEGVAVLRVLVDTSGAVAQCEIQESSGNESLDRAALSAARRTRYTPARCRGQPVRVWTTFSCQFAR
jgi:serine/threonine-protein kinase